MPTTPSPLPRPERAVIGFFLYVTSIFTFGMIYINKIIFIILFLVIYVLWAYLPKNWLENIGITYYPHK